MHKYLVGANLSDLRFQPLINRVFDVKPHTDLVLTLAGHELLDVREVDRMVGRTKTLLPLTEPSILVHDCQVLRKFSCLVINLRIHQAVDVVHCTS